MSERPYVTLSCAMSIDGYLDSAEPHRLAILRNDPVMLGMIDGGDLPADGIAADIDDRKMIGHCRNPYHKKTSNVIG